MRSKRSAETSRYGSISGRQPLALPAPPSEPNAFSPEPCPEVHRAALRHRWDQLAFVHWRCEPAAGRRLLPEGLAPELVDGSAWVGIVPFHLSIAPVGLPELPWISHFPEMNVRTYARTRDGRSGVWFVTLDAARLGVVVGARATYRINYRWAKMRFARVGDYVLYQNRRRSRRGGKASCKLALEIGPPRSFSEATDLDHFLTTRWRFFCPLRRGLAEGFVQHDPWPLHEARLLHYEGDLLQSAGLSPSDADPVCHYSEGVAVRMGLPSVLR